jgi:hypothetical protein
VAGKEYCMNHKDKKEKKKKKKKKNKKTKKKKGEFLSSERWLSMSVLSSVYC